MKKIVIFILNFLIILSLVGLALRLSIGGYSFNLGKIEVNVHHLKNILCVFLGAWFLRFIFLLLIQADFRQQVFSLFKTPFLKYVSIESGPELNIGKNSLITAFFFFCLILFVQRFKFEPLIYFRSSLISSGLANNIFSLIFIFFIIFFYFSWAKRNFDGDFAFLATLLFVINSWHPYRGLMILEFNLLVLLFVLSAFLSIKVKGLRLKSIVLIFLFVFLFQGISFLLTRNLPIVSGFSRLVFFRERIALFSFGRIGVFLLGISLVFLFWYRKKLAITLLASMMVSLILPLRFPQNLLLYFPYVSLFSFTFACGIILILKNPLTNFYSYDRNITFVSIVLILSMCYSYANSNLKVLPERTYESEDSYSRVGESREDKQASSGWSLAAFADKDLPAFMVYGPYRQYFSGNYEACFWIKTNDDTKEDVIATIEVTANAGELLLAQENIRGVDFKEKNRYQVFPLLFEQKGKKKLEFRVFFHRKGDVWVDKIEVNFRDKE